MDRDRIVGAAQADFGRMQAEYGRLADDHDARLAGTLNQGEGFSRSAYGQAKDGLREAVDQAAAYAEGAYDEGRRRLELGAVTINDQVERNPVVAILVAAAAGFLIGMAYRARRN